MKHRSHFSAKQRKARSKLAQIVHEKGFVRGTIITMSRVCGNPNCRCAKGQKHVSLYLSRSEAGKPKLMFIPKRYEKMVKGWVENSLHSKKVRENGQGLGRELAQDQGVDGAGFARFVGRN